MRLVDIRSAAKRSRDYWGDGGGMNLELGDRVSNSLSQNIDHQLLAIIYAC